MIDTGYLYAKNNDRIFINTCLGCRGGCSYCYLPTEERFKTFEISKTLDIPTVLYMKPILKGITIKDIELYEDVIKKFAVKDVVVGSIF